MEILTLLKANIRRRKGSFISVILLTFIVAMSVTVVLSMKESAFRGVEEANEICDTPDIFVSYMAHKLEEETLKKVENDDKVDRVNVIDSILVEKVKIGDNEYGNTSTLVRADDNTRLLKENLSGIKGIAPKLDKGEIYVPQGILTNLHGEAGDSITVATIAGNYEFVVKGIMLEPQVGAGMIGWKSYCISDEDFSTISSAVSKAEREEAHGLGKGVEIYKSDSCSLTSGQLRRQLNLDTGITDMAYGSMTKDASINYTTLFPKIVCSILMVFAMFLLAIVVIIAVHSISVEIEMNYVTFGVLKAQGFGKNKIRLLFMGQYLLAEIIGAAFGIILSIPLIKVTSNIFVTVTAIPAVLRIPIGIILAVFAALFLISAAAVCFVTRKVNKISPVRAISGAKREIYFDSRVNAPICKKILSPSLALRQFTSAKRRYIGMFVIVAILVFFMITITYLANIVNSKSAVENMGGMVTEIKIEPKRKLSDKDFEKIEKEIERFSKIKKAYYTQNSYFSFDGEEVMGSIYKDVTALPALEGRCPKYDNEIAASPILLEEFKLKIGDEVTIGWQGRKQKYLITGTVQFMNDAGRCFLMSYDDAAKRIGYDNWLWGSYSLEKDDDEALKEKIVDSLNEKFQAFVTAEAEKDFIDESISAAITAMQAIIYIFSALFSLIVIHMVCSKAFIQERTDIGIYKAVGFRTSQLRCQFAVRFLMVSLTGACAGGAASYFISEKVLVMLLKSTGIVSVNMNMGLSSFFLPVLIICISFLVFSYLVSGKMKRIKIRELVV
ncbi:MAG: ABC transporter permease [Lachnospiraceae bacterium]|nr:ABC transporter permease [Lachnospiraceae bacterium]